MMQEWEKSEKYRKYFIEVQFVNLNLYTVWGTDTQHEDIDKFLVKGKKIILFNDLKSAKSKLNNYNAYFFDKENFNKWLIEENLDNVYNSFKISNLLNVSYKSLKNREFSLELLDSLNIVQDFIIQTNQKKIEFFFDTEQVIQLKDYIYNDFFWKKDGDSNDVVLKSLNYNLLGSIFSNIYDNFFKSSFIVE